MMTLQTPRALRIPRLDGRRFAGLFACCMTVSLLTGAATPAYARQPTIELPLMEPEVPRPPLPTADEEARAKTIEGTPQQRIDALVRLNRFEEAAAEYAKLLQEDPTADMRKRYAMCLFQAGKFGRARNEFSAVAGEFPEDATLHYLYSWTLLMEGRNKDGLAHAQTAADLAPGDPRFARHLAVAIDQIGNHEKAENVLRSAIDSSPDDGELYMALGRNLLYQDRRDESIAAFKKAIELRPDLLFAYVNLICALDRWGMWDQIPALEASFDKAVIASPTFARAIGATYHQLGHEEDARRFLPSEPKSRIGGILLLIAGVVVLVLAIVMRVIRS